MRIAMAAIAALALAMPGVAAQTAAPDTEGGRYIIRSLDDGVLRIDRETGAASLCREDADGWACRAVPDDREALEEEISRLASENAALARRIGELEERFADAGEAPPPAMENDAGLPTEAELDRIMQTFETMMRRFLDMMRSLKDDFGEDRT